MHGVRDWIIEISLSLKETTCNGSFHCPSGLFHTPKYSSLWKTSLDLDRHFFSPIGTSMCTYPSASSPLLLSWMAHFSRNSLILAALLCLTFFIELPGFQGLLSGQSGFTLQVNTDTLVLICCNWLLLYQLMDTGLDSTIWPVWSNIWCLRMCLWTIGGQGLNVLW